MPFTRPTLTALRKQVAQDISTALPGSDPLLRFSILKILGDALAGLTSQHYGYLDWIAKQAVPFTATEEFLEGWAGLAGVTRKPAVSASGAVTFTGTVGAIIPAGAKLVRGDGKTFTASAAVEFTTSTAVVQATADADESGQAGAFGNMGVGVAMTLDQAIAGVQSSGTVSTAFTGGADIESDDSLRTRMLEDFQNPPHGGAQDDYVNWALEVPGVTRAWCARNGFGIGTAVVYTMLDEAQAAHGGFPQGTDGGAADETRTTTATGDQLTVADYLYQLQPVTALVYSVAPTANPVNFTIKGIPLSARSAILGAISDVFVKDSQPGGSIPIAHIWTSIAAVIGVNDFVIVTPSDDITNPAGALPVVGTITYT